MAGADQPLIDRLLAWHAAAESGDLAGLFGRILDENGLARRELFAGDAMRRLTNFRQLFEVLALDAARARRPLGDIVRRLAGARGDGWRSRSPRKATRCARRASATPSRS